MSNRRHLAAVPALALAAVVTALAATAGPNPHITFVGTVESLPAGPGLAGDWSVAGRLVHVTAATAIDQAKGAPAVGVLVQVKGVPLADHSVDAREIKVLRAMTPQPRPRPKPVEVAGLILSLPPGPPFVGDWMVDRTLVHAAAETRIDERLGPVAIGAFVLVHGTRRDDGSVDASAIAVKRPAVPPRACDFAVLHLEAAEGAPEGAEGVVLTRLIVLPNGTEREDLKVAVEHLLPESSYDVVIDGINAGVVLTNAEGEGHLFLSTADIPGAEPLPAELRPVAERVHAEVLAAGVAVLVGDFADARRNGCGYVRPNYLAVALLLGADGAPRGVAIASIKGDLQTVRFAAWSLAPGEVVSAVADGIVLGSLTAGADGSANAVFSSSPAAGQLPLPIEAIPVSDLLHAELQATDGSVIAGGNFVPAPMP
jgi:hypothetical protein